MNASTISDTLVIFDAAGNEVSRIPVQIPDPVFVAELAYNVRSSLRDGYYLDYVGFTKAPERIEVLL